MVVCDRLLLQEHIVLVAGNVHTSGACGGKLYLAYATCCCNHAWQLTVCQAVCAFRSIFVLAEKNGFTTMSEWYSVPGKYRIGESVWLFQNIEIYDFRQAPESNMTDHMIPKLKSYENEAVEILKKYQPETLKKPCRTDAEALAESMGYHIQYFRLSDDHSVEGKVIFSQAAVKVYSWNGTFHYEEIRDNTILMCHESYLPGYTI